MRKKNTGAVPRNNPTVVKPKATPGAFGRQDTISASVIAIVMLKNAMPISDTDITSAPNSSSGKAPSVLISEVARIQMVSTKTPPIAFPTPMQQNSMIDCAVVLFHEVGMP